MPPSDFMPEFLRFLVEGLRVASNGSVLLTVKMQN
jgi:hypothetical protein